MKYIVLTFIMLLSCPGLQSQTNKKMESMDKKLLRHVVLFKFKDTSSVQGIKDVENAFRSLPAKIKEIKSFEWGLNNSPEKINQGFTHCFFVTFYTEQDRDIYLQHPAHKAFGKELGPYLEKVLVFDYWADK